MPLPGRPTVVTSAGRTARRQRRAPAVAPDPIVSHILSGGTGWAGLSHQLADIGAYARTGLPPGITPQTAVSGHGITPGESEFYTDLARLSGLSSRVLGAQGIQEGGADDATDPYNVLNVGHTDSGEAPVTTLPGWKTPRGGAKLTDKFLRGQIPGYRASSGIQSILQTAGQPEINQIKALAGSGWASDPNYGSEIAGIVNSLTATQPKQGPLGKYSAGGVQPVAGSQFALTNQPGKVVSAAEAIGRSRIRRQREAQGGGGFGLTPDLLGMMAAGLAPKKEAETRGAKVIDKFFNPESDADPYNLNPVLARRLIGVARESGDPIDLTSGYRSSARQAAIDPGTNPKAPPGYSAHQFGMAGDLNSTPAQDALFGRYGLEHGQGGPGVADPPHTELVDPGAIKKAATFGPVRSGYAPSGLEQAVGDLGDYKSGGISLGTSGAASSLVGSLSGGGGLAPSGGSDAGGSEAPLISTAPLVNPLATGPTFPGGYQAPASGGVQQPQLADLFNMLTQAGSAPSMAGLLDQAQTGTLPGRRRRGLFG